MACDASWCAEAVLDFDQKQDQSSKIVEIQDIATQQIRCCDRSILKSLILESGEEPAMEQMDVPY